MDLKESLATNLRRLRHEKGMTQEDLAGLTEVSLRYIGSIERARVSASVTVLGKLAQALQVSPCNLIEEPRRRSFRGSGAIISSD